MDFEALKDQWSDVEDRDGVRLSWNTFPSSRMVRTWLSASRSTPIASPANTGYRKPLAWSFPLLLSTRH